MKKLLMVLLTISLTTATAMPCLGVQKDTPEKPRNNRSAIDVALLILDGKTDAEIAVLLSDKEGFDRESALRKGQTDQQIIVDLVTGSGASKKQVDKGKTAKHKFEGDKYFRSALYDKAASEYTMAIRSSEQKVELFMSRADSYRQYLDKNIHAAAGKTTDESDKNKLDRATKIICNGIYSDYTNADKANSADLQRIENRLIILKSDMTNKEMTGLERGNVAPYHYKAAGKIHSMREMDIIYRQQIIARQNQVDLKKAFADCTKICGPEFPSPQQTTGEKKAPGK